MFHASRLVALSALCVAATACSTNAGASSRPTSPPRSALAPARVASPGASPGASPVAGQADAPAWAQTGSLIALGSYNYADYGFRDVTGKKRQDLDAGKYYFKGTFLRGDPGQSLVLRVQNVDQQEHNLSIPEQGVDVQIPVADGRVEIPVTIPQSGAVRFFCKLYADQGMNGQLLSGDTPLGPVAQLASEAPAF